MRSRARSRTLSYSALRMVAAMSSWPTWRMRPMMRVRRVAAAVTFAGGDVPAGAGQAQRFEGGAQAGLVALDGEDEMGEEALADQRGEAALRVECVGADDPARQGEPLVQFPQHRPDFRDLVRLDADLPLGDHDPARRGRQQERAGPVAADRAADLLSVAVQRRLRERPVPPPSRAPRPTRPPRPRSAAAPRRSPPAPPRPPRSAASRPHPA